MNNKLKTFLNLLKESTKVQIITGVTTVALAGGVSYGVLNLNKTNEYIPKTEVSTVKDTKENEEVAQVEEVQDTDSQNIENNDTENTSNNTSKNGASNNSITDNKSTNTNTNKSTSSKADNKNSGGSVEKPQAQPKPQPKPEPIPQPKPEPVPSIPNGYNAEMTNYVNGSILNRYSGVKTSYFDGLLEDMASGRKSGSSVASTLKGYQWEENGPNQLGEVSRVTAQVFKVKDKDGIPSQIIRDSFRYWKAKVYYKDGQYNIAILGIAMYDIVLED